MSAPDTAAAAASPVPRPMYLQDLIEEVHRRTNLPPMQAYAAVHAVLDTVLQTVVAGRNVTLTNFGTFVVYQRPPRRALNPRTGEPFTTPGGPRVRFKESVNLVASLMADDTTATIRRHAKSAAEDRP